jgi:hypothetical protein
LLMMASVLSEMKLKRSVPINLMDSDAGRALANRLGVGKMRHIQIRWLWLQERICEGDLAVKRVDGAKNTADLGTKYLESKRHDELLDLMGLRLIRRRLPSTIQGALVAALVQAAAASSTSSEARGVADVVALILWFLDGVVKTVAIALILVTIAYRLLTWQMTAALRPERRAIAAQTDAADLAGAVDEGAVRGRAVRGFDLDWLTIEQLRLLCRRKGLATTGLQADLRGRLESASQRTLLERPIC